MDFSMDFMDLKWIAVDLGWICFLQVKLSTAWGITEDKFVSYGPRSAEPGASSETNLSEPGAS